MLRTNKTILAVGFLAVFGIGTAIAIDKRPDSPGPGASSKELVAAAQRTYEALGQEIKVVPDRVRLDDLYIWSKRWMTAEWDLSLQTGDGAKGVKEHLDRMVELEHLVAALHRTGQASQGDLSAAAYYRTEAELMFAPTGR